MDKSFRLTHAKKDFTGFKEIKKVKEERGGEGEEGGDLHVHFLVWWSCVAWKPGRRKDRRESESTHIDEPSAVVIVMQLLFKWYRDLPRLLTRGGPARGQHLLNEFY